LAWTVESNDRNSCRASHGQDRSRPGAKVLGRELLAAHRAEIGIDVARADPLRQPILVEVLEELLAREVLAAADDAGEPAVADVHLLELAALAAELEPKRRSGDADVSVTHRGQPEGAVVASVLGVPDPDRGRLEEPDDGGHHLLPRQPRPGQVALDRGTDARERPTEADEPAVLRVVAHHPPARVITVLLPPARVTAGGLNVATRIRADPDIGPRRRDGESLDPAPPIEVANGAAVGPDVDEVAPGPAPANTRRRVADVVEARRVGCLGPICHEPASEQASPHRGRVRSKADATPAALQRGRRATLAPWSWSS
jgi:hypothetical protein